MTRFGPVALFVFLVASGFLVLYGIIRAAHRLTGRLADYFDP